VELCRVAAVLLAVAATLPDPSDEPGVYRCGILGVVCTCARRQPRLCR
jgi:hypothetical protein